MERTAGFRSEMAMGNSPVDGRTDLYGLGCVAYWLLTGTLVFEEKNATAMLLAHLQKTPPPLAQRTNLAVPASLDRAIMMFLAKEPAQRPGSANALGRQLENCNEFGSWTADDAERWWANMAAEIAPEVGIARPIQVDPDALTTL